ncbi:acyltransferase family protein [Pseudoteredinibacter isoporae]|uniref:acyltransferase family protein n=1 Tax=Pseudoteredinibacter isoporae TaxID=570281 RepID=UPI003107034A
MESKHVAGSMPGLTGLRGVAAMMVLLFHVWGEAIPRALIIDVGWFDIRCHVLFSLGWSGVQVLFVLSAFLLSLPFIRAQAGMSVSEPRLRSYFSHRIARVFPAYYVQLALLLGLGVLLSSQLPIQETELLKYLLMLFAPQPLGVGNPALNLVWWTLPIELSFYFVLPLLAFMLRWRWRYVLGAFFLGVMLLWRYAVVGLIQPDEVSLWALQLPGSLDSFGMGVLAALMHVHCVEQGYGKALYLKVLSLALLLALPAYVALFAWMDSQYQQYWSASLIFFTWTPLFSAITAVVVLACAARLNGTATLFANRAVFYLGVTSYGLYLWHYPVMKWLNDYSFIASLEGYRFPWLAMATFVVSLFLAALSWHCLESKVIGWVKARTQAAA